MNGWTDSKAKLPPAGEAVLIYRQGWKSPRRAVLRPERSAGFTLTDCTHPAQNSFAEIEGTIWSLAPAILIVEDHPPIMPPEVAQALAALRK